MTKRKKPINLLLSILALIVLVSVGVWQSNEKLNTNNTYQTEDYSNVSEVLNDLEIKDRSSEEGYDRDKFSSGWSAADGCDTRNLILQRDLTNTVIDDDSCTVLSGTLADPYSGETIEFKKGDNSIDIDHIVPLSDAWQKGAQALSDKERESLYHDPSNLLAVDAGLNRQKGDDDAASWLPPNKGYYCEYIRKQVGVKKKYSLWVTQDEYNTMNKILSTCTN